MKDIKEGKELKYLTARHYCRADSLRDYLDLRGFFLKEY